MDPENRRKFRLQKMAEWIQKANPQAVDLTKVIAKASFTWGCKRETAKEYLSVLDDTGLVRIDEQQGLVFWEGKE